MPSHFNKVTSEYDAKFLHEIVADVEKYSEFLPWVIGSRITQREENYFIADVLVKFKAFSYKYTSKVYLFDKNCEQEGTYKIKVELVSGPFKHLNNSWSFKQLQDNISETTFELDFKFNSPILEKMIGFLFEGSVKKMTQAFLDRAKILASSITS
jgi:coenzyme Q-binding protein COQ10